MKKLYLVLFFALGIFLFQDGTFDQYLGGSSTTSVSQTSSLSQQEQNLYRTLTLIQQGGPYPYSRDGITFEQAVYVANTV